MSERFRQIVKDAIATLEDRWRVVGDATAHDVADALRRGLRGERRDFKTDDWIVCDVANNEWIGPFESHVAAAQYSADLPGSWYGTVKSPAVMSFRGGSTPDA